MDNAAAVMVRDLRKSYRDVAAVRGIDLEISRGEVFALLGPNGIVLQLASTGPELTVLEIVRHFAAFYPASRRAEEALADERENGIAAGLVLCVKTFRWQSRG